MFACSEFAQHWRRHQDGLSVGHQVANAPPRQFRQFRQFRHWCH
jgi:hypothetical protein